MAVPVWEAAIPYAGVFGIDLDHVGSLFDGIQRRTSRAEDLPRLTHGVLPGPIRVARDDQRHAMPMRDGRSPQQACEDALEMIVDKYRAIGNDFIPGEKFVAINKDGEYGCARMGSRRAARITVRNEDGLDSYEGTLKYPLSG